MKEISIRLKTQEEFGENSHSLPFAILIDGEVQKDVKRFAIDLNDEQYNNLNEYSYLIEKYTIFDLK